MARALRGTDPKAAPASKPKIVLFGSYGIGKSWFALDWPSTYYVDVEGGANLPHYLDKLKKSGGLYLGPDNGSCDFNVVLEEIQTLATTKHHYRTLVIDSFSKLFNSQIAATAEALEKAGKKNEFGADKKPAVGLTRRMIRWLDKLDMSVLLICHEKPVWLNGEQVGVTYDAYEKLGYELHLALHATRQGNSRKAKVVKSRLAQFADAEAFDLSYEAFAAKFGRDVIETEAAPTDMATEAQVKLYTELIATVKLDPKIIERWEENGDAVDMSRSDLQKRIDYLEKLLPKVAVPA